MKPLTFAQLRAVKVDFLDIMIVKHWVKGYWIIGFVCFLKGAVYVPKHHKTKFLRNLL